MNKVEIKPASRITQLERMMESNRRRGEIVVRSNEPVSDAWLREPPTPGELAIMRIRSLSKLS